MLSLSFISFLVMLMVLMWMLFLCSKVFIIDLVLISLEKKMIFFSLKFDEMYLFLIFVVIIGLLIFFYSFYYMEFSIFQVFFFLFKFFFIISMMILILGNSSLTMFFGWDGLGITSYFLVMFFMNWKSNNSGFITILSNRVGDTFFLVSLGMMLMMGFDSFSMGFFKILSYSLFFLIFIFCLTKSAQYPFSSWLPVAMAAPTPISSLVHSSTLVTAGVFLMLRFFDFFFMGTMIFLLILSFFTLLISGMFSLLESDMKKVVALSTLNQMSFMLFSLSNGLKILTFFHLSAHALFKSLLFLNIGVFMHSMFSLQDYRKYSLSPKVLKLIVMSFFFSLMCLIGFSFTSGFFSKDLILESFSSKFLSLILVSTLFLFMFFTFFYSFRLVMLVLKWNSHQILGVWGSFLGVSISLTFLSWLAIIFGKVFFLNFFSLSFLPKNFSFMKLILITMMVFSISLLMKVSYLWVFLKNFLSKMGELNDFSYLVNKMLENFFNFMKFLLEKSFLEIMLGKETNMIWKSNLFSLYKKNFFLMGLMMIFLLYFIFF